MLSAYFIDPFEGALPLWTILDILCALLLIYPAAKLSNNLFGTDVKRLSTTLALISFTVIVTDSLVRVFLLVPVGLLNLDFGTLYGIFVTSAVLSYLEDFIAVAVSFVVGVPLLTIIFKLGHNNKPE